MHYNEYPRFTSRNTGEERPSSHAIVTGSGRVVGNRISEHPDVDLVAITGSVGSGQKVAASAAPPSSVCTWNWAEKRPSSSSTTPLDDFRKDGLTIAVGGSAMEGPGYFIEPTVVTDVPAGAAITSTEIFGPVVSVETFSTEEEAVTRANEMPWGGFKGSGYGRDLSSYALEDFFRTKHVMYNHG